MYLGVLSRTKPVIYYLRSQDLSHVLGSPRFCLLLCKMVTSSPHSSLQGLQGKEPFDEGERENKKAGLKLDIKKTKIMASSPSTSWPVDRERGKQWPIFGGKGGLQNHCGQ